MLASTTLAAACALRLVAGASGHYDTSVRVEAMARKGTDATQELRLDPSARFSLRAGRFQAGLSYSPLLVVKDEALDDPSILHGAGLSAAWSGRRGLEVQATAAGTYGENEFLSVASPASEGSAESPPLQPIPRVTRLEVMSVDVLLRVKGALARAHDGHVELAGFTSGGATSAAREFLPEQRGARLGLGHGWTISPRHSLATAAAATVTEFPDGMRTIVGSATLTWQRALLPDGQAWVGGGLASTAEGNGPGGTSADELLPTAVAGLSGSLGRRGPVGSTVLTLAPITDRLTGEAYQRLDLVASLQMRPGRRWSLVAATSGGFGVSGDRQGDVIAVADLRATLALSRSADLAAGVRGLWQRPSQASSGLPAPSVRELGFFLSVAMRRSGRL